MEPSMLNAAQDQYENELGTIEVEEASFLELFEKIDTEQFWLDEPEFTSSPNEGAAMVLMGMISCAMRTDDEGVRAEFEKLIGRQIIENVQSSLLKIEQQA